jgi:hypothetical protein
MTRPRVIQWWFEADVFPDYSDELIAAIRESGSTPTVLPAIKPGYSFDDTGQPDPRLVGEDSCVIFHGCIGLAERIVFQTDWSPGIYGSFDRLTCSSYFPAFGEFLLNTRYTSLSLSPRHRILAASGDSSSLTAKSFAGAVIERQISRVGSPMLLPTRSVSRNKSQRQAGVQTGRGQWTSP